MTQRSKKNELVERKSSDTKTLSTRSKKDAFAAAERFFGDDLRKAKESGLLDAVEEAAELVSNLFSIEVRPIQCVGIATVLQRKYYTVEKFEEATALLIGDPDFHERVRYEKTLTAVDFTKAYNKKHSGRPVNLEKDW